MARKDYNVGSSNVFEGLALDRLVRLLVLLGRDVEIVVKPRAQTAGRARVLVA